MNNPVGLGIAFPFRIEGGGAKFSVNPDPDKVTVAEVNEVAQSYLDQLFHTWIGEIPYSPEWGNPALSLVLSPLLDELGDAVIFGLKKAMAKWLPGLSFRGYRYERDQSKGSLLMRITVGIAGLSDPADIALSLPTTTESR